MPGLPAANLPPKNFRSIIEEFALLFNNPVTKLKYLNHALNTYQKIPRLYKLYPPFAETAVRKLALDEAEKLAPGSRAKAQELVRSGAISAPQPTLWTLYKYRYIVLTIIAGGLIWFLGTAAAALKVMINNSASHSYQVINPAPPPPDLASLPPEAAFTETTDEPEQSFPDYIQSPIWLVETTPEGEIYSNRLNIITTHTVENIPRRYLVFRKTAKELPSKPETANRVAGILFHASESDLVSFEPEKNSSLKRHSENLLQYIYRNKLYHYFIDRFGRVYRVVSEDSAAFHAGNAIWADDDYYYLNLNHAFIGICFEGRDFEREADSNRLTRVETEDTSSINEMQIKSGKELTDWLRYKYRIPQHNCAPHALVSVNPAKSLIGYHLDLSYGFPFAAFGLADKYRREIPAITEFGFAYDRHFEELFHGKVWPGIKTSQETLNEAARAAKLTSEDYRRNLQTRFNEYFAWQKKIQEQMEEPR